MFRPYPRPRGLSAAWPWGLALVEGASMLPTLRPWDVVLTRRLRRPPRPGEVVVADVAEAGRLVVKRVAGLEGATVRLLSDNPGAGTDSRTWGPVPLAAVQAVVVLRLYALPRRLRAPGGARPRG